MVFTAAPTVPHSMLSLPPVQGQTTILSGDVWMDIIKTEMYFSGDILIDTRLKPFNCWGKSWMGSNRFPDNQALEKWAQGLEMYKSNWLLISKKIWQMFFRDGEMLFCDREHQLVPKAECLLPNGEGQTRLLSGDMWVRPTGCHPAVLSGSRFFSKEEKSNQCDFIDS